MWTIVGLIIGLLSPITSGDIIDKPLLQEITLPKNLAENQTFRLLCALTQGESVNFEWFHNDEKIKENNRRKIRFNDDSSELVLRSLSIDDLGTYRCMARNQYGEDNQSVSLFFNVKPKFIKEPQDTTEIFAKEIKLECEAKGHPIPTIEWTKLTEDKQKIIKKFKSNSIMFDLNAETVGLYRCTAKNSQGAIEKIIKVFYFGK